MTPTIIILAVLGLLALYIIFTFNGLVAHTNRAKEAWADIDVQLKRRYDLIPNLVNTVKGASNFESSTLEKVIQARNTAMAGGTANTKDSAANENQLSGALKTIFALSENYPELKSNANFLSLQSELSDTEDKIQSARRFYNANVMALNTAIGVFPGNVIANSFNFKPMDLYELSEADKVVAQNPVEVKF
jgi:LemA protein